MRIFLKTYAHVPHMTRSRTPQPARPAPKPKSANAGKRPKNLTLDPEAVALGEAYGKRYGTNVSQIVNSFLKALPPTSTSSGDVMHAELSPLTRRLYGIAAGATADRDDHRAHLLRKYRGGSRKTRR